ncbi:hypothetical protein FNV43_RR04938 [Rhamnella rubrinervis]|uniref:Lipoxygenase domain-containing protein n=1 Tax=Rhamnella rubrinervis TaxID=2594499 RepID=A0A8K0MQ15_9ROSA|nr:hypothetical protein FNV43_RR04938 [Rhamnella rubrinervis]
MMAKRLIGDLRSLIVLNLSGNSFTSTIPSSLGNLGELESLDLSKNKLIGGIPQQLENLTFLEYLNMSQNQLTGPIPQGGQLETFSYSSFDGNPGLCGLQLSKKCENTDAPISFHSKEEESESENGFTWKVVVLGFGCGLAVGIIFGHVTLSRRSCWFWRSFVGSRDLKVYKNWVFPDQAHPVDLIKRGMAVQDANSPHGLRLLIEDYPYAVDGLEIWSAINTWTREVLIETCTIIIWIASAYHAAINFGHYPYGGYPPSRPSISHRFIPEEGNPECEELKTNPEKAYLKTFNSQLLSVLRIAIVEILSRHSTDEIYIGQRDTREWTEDAEVLKAFKKFEKKLKEIEEKITRMKS